MISYPPVSCEPFGSSVCCQLEQSVDMNGCVMSGGSLLIYMRCGSIPKTIMLYNGGGCSFGYYVPLKLEYSFMGVPCSMEIFMENGIIQMPRLHASVTSFDITGKLL